MGLITFIGLCIGLIGFIGFRVWGLGGVLFVGSEIWTETST